MAGGAEEKGPHGEREVREEGGGNITESIL